MASKLKTQEVILQSPNGLQEKTVSLDNNGLVNIGSYPIIDSGSNSNGRYVKYQDGTMICYGTTSTSLAIASAWGNLYNTASTIVTTFPSSFISAPSFNVSQISDSNVTICMVTMETVSTTQASYYLVRPSSYPTSNRVLGWTAIGRWY